MLSYVDAGEKRLGLSLATGSGKTVIFTHLIDRVSPPNARQTQTLILAHRQELIQQAAAVCSRTHPDKTIDIEMANSHASGAADITISSIQSILSGDRIDKFDPKAFKLIIVDEAHRIVSPSYLKVGEYFGLRRRPIEPDAPILVGVSATFARNDGLELGAMIDHIVYHKDYIDMIDSGYLAKLLFTTVRSKVDLRRVRTARGDFETSSLSEAVNTDEANEAIVRAWKHCAAERRSTLVFAVDKAHVASLTAAFRAHGVASEYLTSDTPQKKRVERLSSFRSGQVPVLLNCGILTEGTDIPIVDCVLLARPTKSRSLLVQMIGRGVRLCKGKENCLVIDMVSSLKEGIVTTPTLFGLDPDELVERADAEELQERRSRKEKEEEQERRAAEAALPKKFEGALHFNFTHYDDVHDLIADSSAERHIRGMSQFAWVNVGDYRYVLSNRNGDYLLIAPDQGEGQARSAEARLTVWYYQKIADAARAKSPYMAPRRVAKAQTFHDAVRAADRCAQFAFERGFVLGRAAWRGVAATEKQIDFLNRTRAEGEKLEAGGATKGEAADMITKLKFGARGRFSRAAAAKRQRSSRRAP